MKIKVLIFDWGNTVMRDYALPGTMTTWEKVDWIPGVEEALEQLSREYKCVIATSAAHSGTSEMKDALAMVGANVYFDEFFSSNDLGVSKPDPEFFREIIKQLKVFPEECIAIGDKYEKDIVSASKAGLNTILFDENRTQSNSPLADQVIISMNELERVIKNFPD